MIDFNPESWKQDFTRFYDTYSRSLWFYIFKTCGDESLADDIFQEACLRFIRARPVSLNEYQQKSYFYRIATRLIIDWRRRIKVVDHRSLMETDAYPENVPDVIMMMDMEMVFKTLKPGERTLLWLAYAEGYAHEEIAKIMGLKTRGIKVKLFRVRKKLAGILKEKGLTWRDTDEKNDMSEDG